jgi:hypothetical protein
MSASDVISVILTAITDFLSGIGTAIVQFFRVLVADYDAGVDEIMFTSDDVFNGLTTMGIWLLVFLGLALAIGIARLVFAIFRTRR